MQSPSPAKPDSARQELTAAQREMVQLYRTQIVAAEQKLAETRIALGLFLGYVRTEAGLSDDDMDWSLGIDPDGRPFLAGAAKK